MNSQILTQLRELKLGGMASALQTQLEQIGTYESLPFVERLGLLLDQENLSRQQRKQERLIRQAAFKLRASVQEIEELNILRAAHLAMVRAVAGLRQRPDHALIDGTMLPAGLNVGATPVVRGDARSLSIAAASIVAKIRRDCVMLSLAQQHPGYGWETNAGYPTPQHKARLKSHGITQHHRRTFAPIHNILWQQEK